jgi:Mg/Co/Ni transporter MgtE
VSHRLRELARNKPEEAEEFLDTHHDAWEEIAESDPGSAADILEALHEEDAADLLRDLDLDDGADVLDEMRAPAAADVVEELTTERAADLIAEMETTQAVDLLAALEEDIRAEVMAVLDPEVRLAINRLIVYPDDSAGGLMTTDYASLPAGITSGEAIESLRRLHEEIGSNLTYVYVVNTQGKLTGVAPFRELVFARPHTGLEDIMVDDPVAVTVDTDREIVAELIQRYHLISLPVTDAQDHLVGIVKVDEAM